jgi:hypothetical protein
MGVFDDDDGDYLSDVFYSDWKYIRNLIRREKIVKIYGDLGQSFKRDAESDSKRS